MIPSAALNQHIAVLGKTGSGKTYAAKGVVEGLLADKRQVCVLDPTGAWWGLRLAADGKARGFDVILLGGQHADIPLAERSGAAVARLVTQQGASVVIDTSGFTVGEYTRWFIDFAGTLYTTITNPLHLVIDEAHYFMPQGKSPDVDAGRMLHAGNRLMSGGRSKGVRGVLITQRPAKLHKDSLSCADTLIAMRVIAPQDRAAIKDWMDGAGDPTQGKKVLDSLAQLARGEGWVWYPEGGHLERVTFPKIKTYDSSATPTHGAKAGPKVGEIDLAEVSASMAEAVKEAEANDPKLLRAEIARLSKQVYKSASAVQTDPKVIERAVAKAIGEERQQHVRELVERDRIIKDLAGRMGKGESLAGQLAAVLHVNGAATPRAAIPPQSARDSRAVVKSVPQPKSFTNQVNETPKASTKTDYQSGNEISTRQQRFLDTAATLAALGAEVSRETIAGWNGIHPRTGSYGEDLKALSDAGLIVNDRGMITVTDLGAAAAGTIDASEAINRAKSGLSNRQRKFFSMIEAAYPGSISKEEIAAQCDPPIHPRTGSFGEDLRSLVGRGLVEAQRSQYKAREFLFAGS